MALQTPAPSASALIDLLSGHRVTAAIYVGAELGIADLLADGPRTTADLAQATDTHEQSLRRLMRTLCAVGICRGTREDHFELMEMGTHLVAKSERSLKSWALVEGDILRMRWNGLIESIRTGRTASQLAGHGSEHFEEMAKSKLAGLFNEAMASVSRMQVSAILAAYDFSGISTLIDVGGGIGGLICAILSRYPSMRGLLFDLPHCEEAAKRNLSQSGVADRCRFVRGSFFESVPRGADTIVMKTIIHDWNDERCLRILENCRRALKARARLLIVDRVMPEKLEPTADHLAAALMDLNMLCGPGGLERTEEEHRDLMTRSGFRMTRVVPAGRFSVIEAVAT